MFLSTFEHKVDTKGRVSFPSQFRDSLNSGPFKGVIVYRSIRNGCIEGCSMEKMQEKIVEIKSLSNTPEKDDFAQIIFGGAAQLPLDLDGRIILPENLREIAGITGKAVFIGKGEIFEVWEPTRFNEYNNKVIERMSNRINESREHILSNDEFSKIMSNF